MRAIPNRCRLSNGSDEILVLVPADLPGVLLNASTCRLGVKNVEDGARKTQPVVAEFNAQRDARKQARKLAFSTRNQMDRSASSSTQLVAGTSII